MRLALDAMGGDNAPVAAIAGAVQAASEYGVEVILVGNEEIIKNELSNHKIKGLSLTIHNCTDTITMDESPAQAVRQKKDSSIVVAAQLVAQGKADAFVSAGNSGAAMAASLMHLKRLEGVSRPAITTIIPTISGACVLLDVGANVDCKPIHILQFAVMGKMFTEKVLGINDPKIGLLSIGEEKSKGNELTLASYDILRKSGLNFHGNIEGRDIISSKADVIVCDGFIGNVVLKFGEGLAEMIFKMVKAEFKAHPIAWASLPFLWTALKGLRKKLDYAEHGGAPLLGVGGICIISHGGSNTKAFKNALRVAAKFSASNANKAIEEELSKYKELMN